nr:ribonuclease H-like domain-containing protein [Tanacetum cinerariifolium]
HILRLFLSQTKYAREVLERAGMMKCNPCKTPANTDSKLRPNGDLVSDPALYRSLVGSLQYLTFTRSDLSYAVRQLIAYSEADWAGCPTTRRSTSEYRGVANVVAETAWVRNLLHELLVPLRTTTLVYCDNVSAVYLSSNPVQHQRTKHIEIDIHFFCDFVVTRPCSTWSFAISVDIFTKGLPSTLFAEFRFSLSVRTPPAPTAGAY